MKPLQHAQISQKTHGGCWRDYIAVHSFLDSSKAACAHFKHRFLLHHREGIELGARIFGETLVNSENKTIETRRILTEHLIEDVGRIVSVEDWARDLLTNKNDSFYKFLEKKRASIEGDSIPGENELLAAFNLSCRKTTLPPSKNSCASRSKIPRIRRCCSFRIIHSPFSLPSGFSDTPLLKTQARKNNSSPCAKSSSG